MRIKPAASFPHPVLSESTGDYGDRTFQLDLVVQEDPESGNAVLTGSMALDDSSIQDLLASGEAVSGLMITCLDTYLDTFQRQSLGEVRVDLSGGNVRGSVFVRGVVVAAKDTLTLGSEWIDHEFPARSKVVQSGDLIALTKEHRFEAGLEKLAPLESIFHLMLHDEVREGFFELNLDNEAIEILAASSLHGFLSLLRGQKMRDTMLSSLFLPVVMAVLDTMRGDEAYADRRWYSVMSARCNAEGIDFKNGDIAEAAQRLLDAPLGSLQKLFARESA